MTWIADNGPVARASDLIRRRVDVIVALLICAQVVVWIPFLVQYARQVTGDLAIYQATAGGVFRGNALYDVIPAGVTTGFTYPPFAALLLSPFVPLSMTTPFVVLTTISLACAIRVAVLLGRATAHVRGATISPRTASLVLFLILMTIGPTNSLIRLGQIGLILMWLVTEDLFGAVPVRWCGYLIGLAAGIKLLPAIFIVALVVMGRRAEARRAGLAFAITVAIGFAVNPTASRRFWSHLGSPTTVGDKLWSHNQSLSGPLMRLLGDHTGWILYLVLAIPTFVLTMYLVRRFSASDQPLAAFATASVSMLLVAPISWEHYYIWLLPVFGLMVGIAGRRPLVLLLLAPSIFIVSQRTIWSVPYGQGRESSWHGTQLLLGNAYVLVAVALFIWLTWFAFYGRRPSDESTPPSPDLASVTDQPN